VFQSSLVFCRKRLLGHKFFQSWETDQIFTDPPRCSHWGECSLDLIWRNIVWSSVRIGCLSCFLLGCGMYHVPKVSPMVILCCPVCDCARNCVLYKFLESCSNHRTLHSTMSGGSLFQLKCRRWAWAKGVELCRG
jgi:hypothetical protein